MSSSLTDNIFGLSVKDLRDEHAAKHPQPVKVNIQVTDGKRYVFSDYASNSLVLKKRKVGKQSHISNPTSTKSSFIKKTGKKSRNLSTPFRYY